MSIASLMSSGVVQSLQGLPAAQALAARSGPLPGSNGGPIEAAASALGLSVDDVVGRLQQGQSLSQLADERGLGRHELAALLQDSSSPSPVTARPAGSPFERAEATDSGRFAVVSVAAASSASGVYGSSLTDEQRSTLDRLGSLLGTDSDSLLEQLRSGSSLRGLLAEADIPPESATWLVHDGLFFDARA